MSVATTEGQLRYLTAPLAAVARRHLDDGERVLTAIYVEHVMRLVARHVFGLTQETEVRIPTRAFVLTARRALILEDPTDVACTTADRGYLAASCPLDRILAFEMRSHLLDCALTLVMATARGPERVTIDYSGVVEDAFLAAVAWIRARMDGQPVPAYTRADAAYVSARAAAQEGWRRALAALSMKQEHAVERYLVAGERVQEWLAVPLIDESRWWQRLGLGAHEHPPGVLVRSDRQFLLVKETMRIIRGEAKYGSEAWLMPHGHLRAAQLVPGRYEQELQVHLEHAGVTDVVRLPLPPELEQPALALAKPCLQQEDGE